MDAVCRTGRDVFKSGLLLNINKKKMYYLDALVMCGYFGQDYKSLACEMVFKYYKLDCRLVLTAQSWTFRSLDKMILIHTCSSDEVKVTSKYFISLVQQP